MRLTKDDILTYIICAVGLIFNVVASIFVFVILYYVLLKLAHFILSLIL